MQLPLLYKFKIDKQIITFGLVIGGENIEKLFNNCYLFLQVLFIILVLFFCLGTVSAANEIYVNTTGNDTSGTGTSENPYLTIQKGIDNLEPNGIIKIANGEYCGLNNTNITIDKNMTIMGQSPIDTIINGSNTHWIFKILPELNVVISNLTLANGFSNNNGGAIQNYCEISGDNSGFKACVLTMNNCTFTGNTASKEGGVISNQCTINITDMNVDGFDFDACIININHCTFTENNAGINGGAISNNCTLNITGANRDSIDFAACVINVNDCAFTGNSVDGDGGAISNYAIIKVEGVNFDSLDFGACVINMNHGTFTDNDASGNGGVISNNCTVNVSGVNVGSLDFGACILNVNDCIISGNTAAKNGGAISNNAKINADEVNENSITFSACILNVNRSTLINNIAGEDGGAVWNSGTGKFHLNRIVFNLANEGSAIYTTNTVDATDNWWGSNYNPKNNPNNIGGQVNLVNADPWLILTIKANPTSISLGDTSLVTASVTINSNGMDTSSLGHIPDGTIITITTDLGNIGSKLITIPTVTGIATAILKANDGLGIAHLYAILDGFITPQPATVVISATTIVKNVGMLETGIPLAEIILAILMILGGFFSPGKKQ